MASISPLTAIIERMKEQLIKKHPNIMKKPKVKKPKKKKALH